MLLTIDIGNSSTKFGVFDKANLINKISIETNRDQNALQIFSDIEDLIPSKFDSIVISTVVKELVKTYKELCNKFFDIEPFFADHNFDYGFSINYFPPENCGSDRLVDAFAAVKNYEFPCIVCDFGTATTIDAVNEKNEYIGGIITPGPNTLGSALFEKTSKLPKVDFEKPDDIFGNTTVSSIQAGIFYGYIGLVDGIIERMLEKFEDQPKIISTGGFSQIISEESKYVEIIEENLMLEGLRFVYEKMNGD